MIQFYATVGRGLQTYAKFHLETENKFQIDEDLEGKIFFTKEFVDIKILLNLKFVERIFVAVSKINFDYGYTKLDLINSLKNLFTDGICLKNALKVFTEFHNSANESLEKSVNIEDEEPLAKRQRIEQCKYLTNSEKTFRISCRITGRNRKKIDYRRLSKDLGLLFGKLTGFQTNLRNPDVEISINITDSFVLVGIPLTKDPLSKRSYIKHCGLRSTICDVMVHLADLQGSTVILDPMCGAGTILVEALFQNKNLVAVGCDSQDSQLTKCLENRAVLKENRLNDNLTVFRFEIVNGLPFRDDTFDRVICDLPFGQIYLTEELIEKLYPIALLQMLGVTKIDGKIVLLTSEKSSEFLQKFAETVNYENRKILRLTHRNNISLGTTSGCIFVFVIDKPNNG